MSDEAPLLRLEHVSKSFGQVEALTDVTLDVPAGQVTALAGDNGAGKSVLIKRSGRLEVAEEPVPC
jgi:ABC-type sugar transport system ATPase subunit